MYRKFAAVLAFSLTGCVSTYSEESITGGFWDQQIAPAAWIVGYSGNGYTSHETVQTYWLYRAAEITLAQGFDGFEIVAGKDSGSALLPDLIDEGLIGKPNLMVNIRLLEKPLPERPGQTFDAMALKAFLQPHVEGEKCDGNVCPHVHKYLLPGFAKEVAAPP
jgi:hypothetical protein